MYILKVLFIFLILAQQIFGAHKKYEPWKTVFNYKMIITICFPSIIITIFYKRMLLFRDYINNLVSAEFK